MGKRELNVASRISELAELERERALMRRMEAKGMTREAAETERQQMEMQAPYVITSPGAYDQMIEHEIERRKGLFIGEFLEQKKRELKRELTPKERQKFTAEGRKLWDEFRTWKRKYAELEERSHTEVLDWKTVEKTLRLWLENEGKGRGWTEKMIQNTIQRELGHFQTAQHLVEERLKAAAYSAEEDFRRRMLDPKTRKAAVRYFLHDSVDKAHWLIETLDLLFSELDRLKRR